LRNNMSQKVRLLVPAFIVAVLLLAMMPTPEPLDERQNLQPEVLPPESSVGGSASELKEATSTKRGLEGEGGEGGDDEQQGTTDSVEERMRKGQLVDENKVEAPLPPLGVIQSITLNLTSPRIFNDKAASEISLTIGVLTVPGLLRSRLIPLLESSLKHEKDIHVFFMDTPKTIPGREALAEYLEKVNRADQVHIVTLPPPKSLKMALRNAWVNLPAVKYFREVRPNQKYFAIMDDDTYFLMNAIRHIIGDVERNKTHTGPVYLGAPITDGLRGGCRLVRSGKTKRAFHTTGRKEVIFVCGGSGIIIDRLAMDELFKVRNVTISPTETFYDYCIATMFQGAGDVRLGHCLSEANVPIITRREMFRDTMFRAIGEKRVYNKHPFPASFHRFRRREWQYVLRAVEDAREQNELVTWGDLLQNFRPGPVYYHSMFHPMKYDNYTDIMGLKRKTAYQLRRENILQRKYHCGRKVNTDEW
jgi:hypothetical protein